MSDDLMAQRRLVARYRGHLGLLTKAVRQFLAALDQEMKLPSTVERGKRIAALVNALEMANDQARHFGLGEPL